MKDSRTVAMVMGNGHIGLTQESIPVLKPGAVLVEVHSSLVSPGTELGGWSQLKRQREHPDAAAQPKKFGYCNAGVVLAVGEGVSEFKKNDRVACIGAGYAQHTDYAVVPHHLCARLPDNVSFAQGSYAMLAATALHAVRRMEPQIGEFFAVAGLGLVGQLTAQMLQLSGGYVAGWDTVSFRTQCATGWGIDLSVESGRQDEIALTRAFTGGAGLDGAVIAFGGDGTEAFRKIIECLKLSPDGHRMGRVVVVGGATMNLSWTPANLDVRIAARTGPGYHDETWEFGAPYPPVFMRWNTRANLELCLRLIAEKRLNVDALTTHTIALNDVDAGISAILDHPENIQGVIFTMK